MPAQACIWFEADPSDDVAVRQAFGRMQQGVLQTASTHARLMRRPDLKARDGGLRNTWMEVWPLPDPEHRPAFLAHLAELADLSGATALARGGRHVEIFEDVTPASG